MVTAPRSGEAPFPLSSQRPSERSSQRPLTRTLRRSGRAALDGLTDGQAFACTESDRGRAVVDPASDAVGTAAHIGARRVAVLVVQLAVADFRCRYRLRVQAAVDEHEA